MNTRDTSYDIWGDTWGQYIIIDMEEENQKKCEKNYNQKLRNISKMDCIDEEEWSNMEMGIYGYDERNNVTSNDKNETLMDIVYSICAITWVMCTTLINKSHMK